MTPRMVALVRDAAWEFDWHGPVLEIGSYVEKNQDCLDLRRAFPKGTPYVGADVIDGPGVNRHIDLVDESACLALVDEVKPAVILCLYVLEHAWDIKPAASTLGAMWRKSPESWLWVSTHQQQPYHGTANYGDWWRITAPGMRRLMEAAGVPDAKIVLHADSSNPEDVLAIRQPASMPWPQDTFTKILSTSGVHWEQY